MEDVLRVLIVEDSIPDTFLIVRELQNGGFQVEHVRVETCAQMSDSLKSGCWDLLISDYSLPQFSGPEALSLYAESGSEAPFIVVSGAIGEVKAAEVVRAGAHNCVLKNDLKRLVPVVKYELKAARERRIRRQTEEHAAFLASIVQSCSDPIVGKALDGTIVSWNEAAERLYGYTAAEAIGRSASMLVPAGRPDEWLEVLDKVSAGQHLAGFETVRQCKDGRQVEVLLTISPIRDTHGKVIGASSIAHDIAQRRLDEDQRLALIQELTSAVARLSRSAQQHPPATPPP